MGGFIIRRITDARLFYRLFRRAPGIGFFGNLSLKVLLWGTIIDSNKGV